MIPCCSKFITGEELKEKLGSKEIIVEPLLQSKQIDATGVDLRLDNNFKEFIRTNEPFLSPGKKNLNLQPIKKDFSGSLFLQPGEFVLGLSFEYICLPNNVISLLNGKSAMGRRGLQVHATANIIDPGWKGHIVFELSNLGKMPIQLIPLMRVAKLLFIELPKETVGYSGTFNGQVEIMDPPVDEFVKNIYEKYEDREKELEGELSEFKRLCASQPKKV